MTLDERIITLTGKDLIWDFEGGAPYFKTIPLVDGYHRHIKVDPFPCTPHDVHLIKYHAEIIEAAFPVGSMVNYYIIPFETVERTNAWANYNKVYDDEIKKRYPLESTIVFAGKRTIIHPAMTAYLIAHEYGHVVDYWIREQLQKEVGKDECPNPELYFHQMYADMRGIEMKKEYGGGRWIDNIVEIIADDFRIVVGKTDPHFYLHTCGHPNESDAVKNFWKEAIEKWGYKNEE